LIDVSTAARVIETQFPALAPAAVSYLGQGYDSVAFDVNGRWVFRFPMREEVEAQLLVEWRILPQLAGSPIPVPDFQFHGRPSPEFPRHFGGYPMLPGVPSLAIPSAAIPTPAATAIGRFLAWLHARPVEDAMDAGVPRQNPQTVLEELRTAAEADLGRIDALGRWPASTWLPLISDAPPRPSGADALVHGDLAAEHLLYDTATQSFRGAIDWSEIAIGDPAVDLAAALHWGDARIAAAILQSYGPVSDDVLDRARVIAACRGAADIVFGLETRRHEYVEAGVRALTLGRVQRLVRLLGRDVSATIGAGFEEVIADTAAERRALRGSEDARYEEGVVNDLQQFIHDTRADTAWPRCPHHPNHPLWFSDGWWRCEQRGDPIARLGDLGPR
jgi:aminoglycoside phosphotransferase (APT) family kinase protein